MNATYDATVTELSITGIYSHNTSRKLYDTVY